MIQPPRSGHSVPCLVKLTEAVGRNILTPNVHICLGDIQGVQRQHLPREGHALAEFLRSSFLGNLMTSHLGPPLMGASSKLCIILFDRG